MIYFYSVYGYLFLYNILIINRLHQQFDLVLIPSVWSMTRYILSFITLKDHVDDIVLPVIERCYFRRGFAPSDAVGNVDWAVRYWGDLFVGTDGIPAIVQEYDDIVAEPLKLFMLKSNHIGGVVSEQVNPPLK